MKKLLFALGVFAFCAPDVRSDDCGCSAESPVRITKEYSPCESPIEIPASASVTCGSEVTGSFTTNFVVTTDGVNPPANPSCSCTITCEHENEFGVDFEVALTPQSDSSTAGDGNATSFDGGKGGGASPKSRANGAGGYGRGTPMWRVGLGQDATGNPSGQIRIEPEGLYADEIAPSALAIVAADGRLDICYHTDWLTNVVASATDGTKSVTNLTPVVNYSFPEQILTKECFVTVSTNATPSLALRFFRPDQVETELTEEGSYALKEGAEPYVEYAVSRPEATERVVGTRVVEQRAGQVVSVLDFAKETSADGRTEYNVYEGGGLRSSRVRSLPSAGGSRTERRTVVGNGGPAHATERSYLTIGGRELLTSVVRDPDGLSRAETYAYGSSPSSPDYGRITRHVSDGGLATDYAYDGMGRTLSTIVSAPGLPLRRTVCSYAPLGVRPHCPDGNGFDIADDDGSADPGTPRVETEYVGDTPVSKTLRFVALDTMKHRIVEEVRLADPAATNLVAEWDSETNVRTYTDYMPYDRCKPCSELPSLVMHEDGRIDRYAYSAGEYEPGANGAAGVFTDSGVGEGDWFRTVVTHYAAGDVEIPNVTTRDVKIEIRSSKKILLQEQYVCTAPGEYARVSWTATTRDDLGQETLVVKSDGTRVEKAYAGRRLASTTDAEGLTTTYSYDALGRVIAETKSGGGIRPDTTTTTTYDPEDRVLSRTVTAGDLSETETYAYDALGRTVATTDAAGLETRYLYATDATAGLETRSTIRAFGTDCAVTNTVVSYADGRTKETRLNGVVKTAYEYGPNWTKTYEGPAGIDSPRWSCSYEDALGRTICETRPGFGGTTLVTSNIYNSAGNLLASRLSDSQGKILNSSIFCYDSSGQRYLSVEDLNCNSIIDFTEADRVVSNDTRFVKIDGDWWRESSSWQTRENDSAALTRISCVRERLTGLGITNLTSEIKSLDIHGNLTTTCTYRDRNALTFTQITDTPDSIFDAKAISIAGLLSTNITASGIISDYAYDALGRQLSEADGRGNVTETCYDEKGRVVQTLDGAGNVTTYTYDALGRQTSVTDPNGMRVTTAYDAEGHVISQRGATYPVDYAYDEFGNKVAMMCYREEGNGDITRWFYDEATGFVTNKVYADGKGPSYTYTPDGKLASRTWARGVVTTYAYDNSGALTNTVYSDDTPTISMVYDRVGNMLSAVTDGVCTNLYAYSLTGLCTNEVQNGATIARSYDALGRSTGYILQASQTPNLPTATVTVSYSYDVLGRIASITSETNTFTYSYLLGTDLVSGYTCGNFSRKIEFEPLRNLVAAVTNSYANRVISAFDYTNDAAGRRTAISRSGEAFGDLSGATDSYGYNSRNEVISARRTKNGEIIHGFNEDFEYDPIGNRIWSTTYNELGEPKTSQYIANSLNQYTSRTVPGYAAVRGHADADATVTVNENPTYRYGEYFFGSDEFDNSQFAVEAELVTSAVLASPTNGPDEVCSVTSRVHIPKAMQHFTYDLDGNLSTDGYYTFAYDSDNRLKTVSTNGVLILTNFYDEKSRRVKKVTADAVITFFYDDWNLVEERIVYTNGAMTTIHYCWGTDLSGTLHGAGGVGGLLYLTVDDEIYIPCYDNNGNITQYLDVNGYGVASYAYDSFGGIITKSGPLADFFRHRFSTKYLMPKPAFTIMATAFTAPALLAG